MLARMQTGRNVFAAVLISFGLAGCATDFVTSYNESAPDSARHSWGSPAVVVTMARGVTTTEENSFIPDADIVWHGEPKGDRLAQASAIVKTGVEKGFAGLSGGQPVTVHVTLKKFHSLSPRAFYNGPGGSGVHSTGFVMSVHDSRNGALLAGPEAFEIDLPAVLATNEQRAEGVIPGGFWKQEITDHIGATLRGWLGTGPDKRGSFQSIGR